MPCGRQEEMGKHMKGRRNKNTEILRKTGTTKHQEKLLSTLI
jgi:hypothetical protein